MNSRTGKIACPLGVDTIVDAADVGVRAKNARTKARNCNLPTADGRSLNAADPMA